MDIREASDSERNDVLFVERAAFGSDCEAELVSNLLEDPSAKPILSLLAFDGDRAVGHILLTTAHLTNKQNSVSIALLAPLAVIPDVQRQGIGGNLIEQGLNRLSESGVDLVFVLGHPGYYSRHGFQPAGCLGFEAPYPIPEEHAEAWMVRALRPDAIDSAGGKVVCADAISQPEYWRED
ncbi:N-acetyltransferase [Lusitaniella coriacea LEGE 07157]|uniref:N-acetyltransferase n=1 Tax=Lusitaniella coriacea LEGE 07157 TaxID=945747 RepID=A0A8J7B7Y0_9CYAN|nr:N-acetyltransferase [Lusitaniella coriacea]MBE9114790.1 N-acetyltransferase [Lusitaniella coriacea LEGE 07157]